MKTFGTIEFFTFESEVWYRATDGTQRRLTESDSIVRELLAHLSEFYPDALASLEEHYKRLSGNIVHYRFRIVQRFCKCNLGNIDHVADVCSAGRLHLELNLPPLPKSCRVLSYSTHYNIPTGRKRLGEAQGNLMARVVG